MCTVICEWILESSKLRNRWVWSFGHKDFSIYGLSSSECCQRFLWFPVFVKINDLLWTVRFLAKQWICIQNKIGIKHQNRNEVCFQGEKSIFLCTKTTWFNSYSETLVSPNGRVSIDLPTTNDVISMNRMAEAIIGRCMIWVVNSSLYQIKTIWIIHIKLP